MEYLDGLTLEDYLDNRKPDIKQKIHFWDAVASAKLLAPVSFQEPAPPFFPIPSHKL
jgi:hypothetical protein